MKRPIPEYGQHMTREEFIEAADKGNLVDDDGHGELATDVQTSDLTIIPSEVDGFEWPSWATHVVWYNK